MIYPTLGEWEVIADTTPKIRPIALAIYSTAAFKEFLKSPPLERDHDPDDGTDAQAADETSEAAE
jgi:hypothetical protein